MQQGSFVDFEVLCVSICTFGGRHSGHQGGRGQRRHPPRQPPPTCFCRRHPPVFSCAFPFSPAKPPEREKRKGGRERREGGRVETGGERASDKKIKIGWQLLQTADKSMPSPQNRWDTNGHHRKPGGHPLETGEKLVAASLRSASMRRIISRSRVS